MSVVSPFVRLAELAEAYDLTVEETLTRLLDRDPHTHAHACPTCRRLALTALRREHDEHQETIPVLNIHADDPEAEAARYAAEVEEWHARR